MPLWQWKEVQEMLRRIVQGKMLGAWAAALLSGFLLACSFPAPEWLSGVAGGSAAWLALLPLLLVLMQVRRRPLWGALAGLVTGLVFYGISLSWLLALRYTWGNVPLTVLAWMGLSLYCSLYLALFGACTAWTAQRVRQKGRYGALWLLVAVPALWAGSEWLRAVVGTGFPWNVLGTSQYTNPVLLQTARWFGVYGVSALLLVFQTSLVLTGLRIYGETRKTLPRSRVHLELMAGLLVMALAWSYGMRSVLAARRQGTVEAERSIRVAVVQPAIPQVLKWSQAQADAITHVLATQSELALLSRPTLVVWPETATPGMLRFDAGSRDVARSVTDAGVWLLAGSMDADPNKQGYYNAGLLLSPAGGITATYRKRHLVPFGEFVPFARWVPLLERLAPLGFSCVAGRMDQPLLHIPLPDVQEPVRAGVLICFEDVFPYVSRFDVKRGARLLINQTNDGWFDGTAASRQHLAQAVLRCVENGVPMVRAANTGISAFIAASGAVTEAPDVDAAGLRGFGVRSIRLPGEDFTLGLYTRYGDWLFGIPCAIYLLMTLGLMGWRVHRERRGGTA